MLQVEKIIREYFFFVWEKDCRAQVSFYNKMEDASFGQTLNILGNHTLYKFTVQKFSCQKMGKVIKMGEMENICNLCN